MDPVGIQKRISSGEHNVSKQKNVIENASPKISGNLPSGSSPRKVSSGAEYAKYQGKVKGNITHTYGVGGKGDPE